MGTAMIGRRAVLSLWLVLALAGLAAAEERYALVGTGAPGGEEFSTTFGRLERDITAALTGPLGFGENDVIVLSGVTQDPSRTSTREHVRDAIQRLEGRTGKDD